MNIPTTDYRLVNPVGQPELHFKRGYVLTYAIMLLVSTIILAICASAATFNIFMLGLSQSNPDQAAVGCCIGCLVMLGGSVAFVFNFLLVATIYLVTFIFWGIAKFRYDIVPNATLILLGFFSLVLFVVGGFLTEQANSQSSEQEAMIGGSLMYLAMAFFFAHLIPISFLISGWQNRVQIFGIRYLGPIVTGLASASLCIGIAFVVCVAVGLLENQETAPVISGIAMIFASLFYLIASGILTYGCFAFSSRWRQRQLGRI